MKDIVRIELHFHKDEVVKLEEAVKKSGRSRKAYCETVIRQVMNSRSLNFKSDEIEYCYIPFSTKPYLILNRLMGAEKTLPCPFCGVEHIHGWGDGHRLAHCTSPNGLSKTKASVTAPDGTVLNQDDGYVLRNI